MLEGDNTTATRYRDTRHSKTRHPGGWRWGWGKKAGGAAGTSNNLPRPGAAGSEDVALDVTETGRSSVDEKMPAAERQKNRRQQDSRLRRSNSSPDSDDRNERVGRGEKGKKRGETTRLALGGQERDQGDDEVEVDLRTGVNGVEGGIGGAGSAVGGGVGDDEGSLERRKRRKDVYSYFMMALVRALEAQAGTTSWLKRVGFFWGGGVVFGLFIAVG